jgi:CAAX protease family protein
LSGLLGVFWNRAERRLRGPWRILSFLLLNGLIAGGLYLGSRVAVHFGFPTRWLHGPLSVFVGVFAELATVATAVVVTTRWIDRRPLGDLGLRLSRPFLQDAAAGFVLGAVLMAFVFLLERSLGWVRITGFFRNGSGLPFAVALLGPLVLFLAAGLSEELVTRGYLLRNLSESLRIGPVGPGAALVMGCLLSSAVFGLTHVQNPNATFVSTFNITLAGILLSFGYMLTGRLGLSVGLHAAWNFFQGCAFGFPVSGMTIVRTSAIATSDAGPEVWTGGAFGPEGGLVGVLAILLGILLIGAWVHYRYGRTELHVALLDAPSRPTTNGTVVEDTAYLAS